MALIADVVGSKARFALHVSKHEKDFSCFDQQGLLLTSDRAKQIALALHSADGHSATSTDVSDEGLDYSSRSRRGRRTGHLPELRGHPRGPDA